MRFKLILAAFLFLQGCEITKTYHGTMIDMKKVAHFIEGKTMQKDVLASLGEPTVILPYSPHTWYYLYYQRHIKTFQQPSLSFVSCYRLTFSPEGFLSSKEISYKSFPISISSHSIPLPSSHGEDFLKQIFRNTGRFPSIGPQTSSR